MPVQLAVESLPESSQPVQPSWWEVQGQQQAVPSPPPVQQQQPAKQDSLVLPALHALLPQQQLPALQAMLLGQRQLGVKPTPVDAQAVVTVLQRVLGTTVHQAV